MKKIYVCSVLSIAFIVFLISCNFDKDVNKIEDDLIKVEIGPDDLVDEINLSQIVDDFRLVRLETNENCLIGKIDKIIFYKNFILIFDLFHQTLFLYSENGDFLRKIGKRGGGPGEFLELQDFTIDSIRNQILLLDYQKIHKFSFDGKYIESKNITFIASSFSLLPFEDIAFYGGAKEYRIIITDKKGEIKAKYFPYSLRSRIHPLLPITHYENKTLFDIPLCDTIYEIKGSKIIPFLFLDFGDLSFTYDDYLTLSDAQKSNVYEYVHSSNIYMYHYLFIPTKKQFYFAIATGGVGYSGFYNLKTENSLFFPMKKMNNDLFGADFPFYPLGVKHNEYIFLVSANSLLKSYENEIIKSKKIDSIIENIDKYSNPVLLFVKIKEQI